MTKPPPPPDPAPVDAEGDNRKRADAAEARVKELEARAEVERLERLRAWDKRPETLPGGLLLEYGRLDGMWQGLVRDLGQAKADNARLRALLGEAHNNFDVLHKNECVLTTCILGGKPYECDCGVDDLLARIDAELKGAPAPRPVVDPEIVAALEAAKEALARHTGRPANYDLNAVAEDFTVALGFIHVALAKVRG